MDSIYCNLVSRENGLWDLEALLFDHLLSPIISKLLLREPTIFLFLLRPALLKDVRWKKAYFGILSLISFSHFCKRGFFDGNNIVLFHNNLQRPALLVERY